MSIKIKAGTNFVLPVEIEDENFSQITAIEFLFKQTENGDTLKTAYWSRSGGSRDASLKSGENTILVKFTREDTYLFKQDEMFYMDTRIHYYGTSDNPYTPIVRMRMNRTLFADGEEAGGNV